jgi:short-subunit dehydrogenase
VSYWFNKSVLVTGGSSGLGRIIAETFYNAGANLTIVALEKNDVETAAAEISASSNTGNAVFPLHADITKQEDVERVFAAVNERWNRLDVLVNNAGRSMRGKVLDTAPEQFQALFDLNVLGTIRCTRSAVSLFNRNTGSVKGHIINIGSLAAKSAARYVGAYPVSKFAVAAFSQQLRLELEPEGIYTLLVCPGPIQRDDERLYPLEGLENIPESARRPGAGVKTARIVPQQLADKILRYAQKRKAELVVPGKARLLFALSQLFPRLGDWIVKKET